MFDELYWEEEIDPSSNAIIQLTFNLESVEMLPLGLLCLTGPNHFHKINIFFANHESKYLSSTQV